MYKKTTIYHGLQWYLIDLDRKGNKNNFQTCSVIIVKQLTMF